MGRASAGLGRPGARLDRRHDLRRRRGGRAREPDRQPSPTRSGDAGLGPIAAFRISNSLFLALTLAFVVRPLLGRDLRDAHGAREPSSTRSCGRLFAHAFIPIALAYLVAHYFSLFVFQEQAQFTFLLSDPLGDGSDLFGTADGGIDYTVDQRERDLVRPGRRAGRRPRDRALVLGHDRALQSTATAAAAARSQYWMLALMVGFTSLGLYLLSQANG